MTPDHDPAELIERYRREIPAWGHLPAAMRFKQAAVQGLGTQAAFVLCQSVLQLPHAQVLQARAIRSLAEVAAGEAARYLPLWPGRDRFERPPLSVIGAGNHGAMPGRGRAAYLCCLHEVTVRSRSALVLRPGEALMDFEGEEYAQVQDLPQFDPAVLHGDASTLWTFEAEAPPPRIEEGFHLLARNAVDFGHWLTEYLPRYVLARMAGLPASVPLLIDPVLPANLRQALEQLAPKDTPIIVLPALEQRRVGRLWVAANPNFSAFYPAQWGPEIWSQVGNDPQAISRMLDAWLTLAGPTLDAPTGRDRVFLARKPGNAKKRLLNHAAIEALAEAQGFERIYPEDLPLLEQIRLVRQARDIIAPEGSNALLAWFARPGTRVCILSPPYTLPLVEFNAILAERGIALTVITGPDQDPGSADFCDFWNDYQIATETFAHFLRETWTLA